MTEKEQINQMLEGVAYTGPKLDNYDDFGELVKIVKECFKDSNHNNP